MTPFIPDLRIWFDRNTARGTLPREVASLDLAGVCDALGVPCFNPLRPWTRSTRRVVVEETRDSSQRILRYRIGDGGAEYAARWSIGPDGDLWQTEYPVKSSGDLALVEALVDDESIAVDRAVVESVIASPTPGDIVTFELPMRPFSRLLLEMLGFGEGYFVLMEAEDRVTAIIDEAEKRYAAAVASIVEAVTAAASSHRERLARLTSGTGLAGLLPVVAWSPDNLDGQFLTPGYFERWLEPGYAAAATAMREAGMTYTVHAGGPVGSLLPLIGRAGIGCVAGVCGPPQGDSAFPVARAKAGTDVVLWGGVAQDALLPSASESDHLAALESAVAQADERCIIGIADHVGEETPWERLRATAQWFTSRSD
jgi:hypothetical protein